MSRAVREKAKELLGYGLPKQTVFDTILIEHPEAKPKKVAEILRYMPTQWAKERYRGMHMALLGLIAASALLRVLGHLLRDGIRWDMPTAYLSLVPIASLLVGWSILRWQGQVFEWVGWGNVFAATGLISALGALAKGQGDPKAIVAHALTAAIGGLALYLARKVFAEPKREKDPSHGSERFAFAVEDGR
jgi:hypothetical protein